MAYRLRAQIKGGGVIEEALVRHRPTPKLGDLVTARFPMPATPVAQLRVIGIYRDLPTLPSVIAIDVVTAEEI